jgi:glycosyltransferase involved in cell wall biosynthesis
MKLGIVIPSFNQRDFLEDTIRSCIDGQTDVEIVVMDGGSKDGSVEIIERYAKHFSYWKAARDNGQSEAINEGVRRLSADYFTWLNSDDVLRRGALEAVRGVLVSIQPDVIFGNHDTIDAKGDTIGKHYHPPLISGIARHIGPYIPQPGTFIRKSAFLELGGVESNLHCVMDTDLWYRFMNSGKSFYHLNHTLAAFRKHGESKGAKLLAGYAMEYRTLRERYGYGRRDARFFTARAAYVVLKYFSRLIGA